MKKQHIKNIVSYHRNNLPSDTKTDWKRVNAMSERELEKKARSDKDTFFADKKFWRTAKLVIPPAIGKERITIRVDEDVLDWLREEGRGYQSRINALLRACMSAMKNAHHRS